MAFERLSGALSEALKKITKTDRINEGHLDALLREVKVALLEADVNTVAVDSFNPANVKSDAAVLATMRGESRKWVWRWAEDSTPAASRSDLPSWRLAARATRPPAPALSCIAASSAAKRAGASVR